MEHNDLIETCKDYGIKASALKIAAITELLSSERMEKKNSVGGILTALSGVLEPEEQMNVIRWATWVQHAQANGLEGGDIESLIEIRRDKDGS
jgi:hypothetical protein